MNFGFSAALIALTIIGLVRCELTAPLDCASVEVSNGCSTALEQKVKNGESSIRVDQRTVEDKVYSKYFFIINSGTDCRLFETEYNRKKPKECEQCEFIPQGCRQL